MIFRAVTARDRPHRRSLFSREALVCVAILQASMAAWAMDACTVVSRAEMSDLMGTKIVPDLPTTQGVQVVEGVNVCSYISGAAPNSPGAIVLANQSQGTEMMARWCQGLDELAGVGDRACIRLFSYATTLAATKGRAAVEVILFYPPGDTLIADPKSIAMKVAQLALTRLQ